MNPVIIDGAAFLQRYPGFKLIGRADLLNRLVSILMRDKANSVFMLAAGGAGATSLCLGLQDCKNNPNAPFDATKKRLFWLDTDALFGSGDSKEINSLWNRAMEILRRTPDSVMVVEDTRDFIEGTRNTNTSNLINSLITEVKNKKTQVIFEVRDDDLDAILKCHSDFRVLFTILPVAEPEGDELTNIVMAAASKLSKHHGIAINADAVTTAIMLKKYRTNDASLNRAQPEKSITLLDRALASYRLEAHKHTPPDKRAALDDLYAKMVYAENAIERFEEQLEEAKKKDASNPEYQQFESKATGSLRQDIGEMTAILQERQKQYEAIVREVNAILALTGDHVIQEFSRISGIDVGKLKENELEKIKSLEASLSSRVFGQEEGIKKITNAIKVAKVGRRNGDAPQAAFLIMGPSGVGKTEVAKALAAIILGNQAALTRFDMSEYMEKHAVAKMIGAPPGYEGFEVGGILTNAMRRNPNRILLFDEIEKAHPDVFNIFLQILSDGRLTDNVGRQVSFSESIVIMTTNIGQEHFLDEGVSWEQAVENANEVLGQTYRSEFLNRFNGRQNILCFKPLNLETMGKIVEREIKDIAQTYAGQGINISVFHPEVITKFCERHYDRKTGARGLPGYIKANLEPIIVDAIFDQKTGDMIVMFDEKTGDLQLGYSTSGMKKAS